MSKRFFIALLLTAALPLGAGAAEDGAATPGLQLEVSLMDGSRVIGVPGVEALDLRTDFATIRLPLALVREWNRSADGTNGTFSLRNGDRLTGALDASEIPLATLFGKFAVPLAQVRKFGANQAGRAAVPAEGLVLHYAFDPDEAERAVDGSPRGHHGRIFGAVFTPDGKRGGGLRFDGIDDYVDAGTPAGLQLVSGFTLAAWIKSDCPGPYSLITKSFAPDRNARGFEFQLSHLSQLGGYFWKGEGQFFSGVVTDALIQHRLWTHVAIAHDPALPAHQMRFYINGKEQAANYGYETTASIPVLANVAAPLRIGCVRPGAESYKGSMDEVMIFNRALTADEVAGLALP
jgi:hypothetical protein